MIKLEKFTPFLLIFGALFFILFFYGDIVLAPNHYLFSESGDGIKNYFTYAAHIKNDTSFTESQAFNYPYGENFLYLDCHPVFTVVLKMLAVPFPSIQNYSVGIINFLMIFSIVISAFFIYLILIEFKVKKGIAALGGLAIAALAPQLFRLTGHLALSYSFFIPLSWYLYIRFASDTSKVKWVILLFINNLMWYFIHAYLGMILVAFMLLMFVIDALLNRGKKLEQWIKIMIVTILPMALFWLIAFLIDHHLGRTNNPYGYLVYASNFQSVFFPSRVPLKLLFDKFIIYEQSWEGYAYVGFGAIVPILLMLTIEFKKLVYKKSIPKSSIAIAFYAAFVLLLLSMGYPFKLNLESLLDVVPIIKNFRGIGRFSWVFFYVATIASIVYLSQLYNAAKRKLPIFIFLLVVSISFFVEAIPYHIEISKAINRSPNLFDKNQLPSSDREGLKFMEKDKYQAIIPLPYYQIGSENNWRPASEKIFKLSMVMAFHSEIPLMSNYSGRTSIPEARKLMQLFGPSYYQKEIEQDFRTKLPFLIICSNEELSENEQNVLQKGKLLFSNNEYSLLSLPFDSLFKNSANDEIENFQIKKNHLFKKNEFYTSCADTTSSVFYESYDELKQNTTRNGTGAYKGAQKDYSKLLIIEPKKLKMNTEYVFSFWMHFEGDNYAQDALGASVFVEGKTPDGKIKRFVNVNPMFGFEIDKSWILVESSFKIEDVNDEISIVVKGNDRSKKFFVFDDLLMCEKENTVFKVERESNGRIIQLFKNNHRIIAQ